MFWMPSARAWAVQVLTPEQELDRVVTGRHIGLDAAELMQRVGEQLLGDGAGIDGLAREGEARAGDDVGAIAGVLL